MTGRALLHFLLFLLLPGCALARYTETDAGQPLFILVNPACLAGCGSSLGTVRSLGGGNQSLSQATTAAAGVAP